MKRLYKSSTDKQIMGVCGGIAEYFNVDPTIVRVLVALSIFVFSIGFWPYIILGIVLPYDYQVNNIYDKPKTNKADEAGGVYRNLKEKSAGIFQFGQETSNEPKDVTPEDSDEWADF